ncbi:ABC transporter permease (plasmid) [Legionella adelaidensis]|uniref:ABC transporter permease n=1 Tax=Legionella adelaidensis TaxID=45056 RepID=A0A0W0R3A9_9GAMM|nr:Fe-S cluster assembly protein SufD [Legionella adelaidensis]KTC65527.1 ABC transporter permease [Legionella adelaidensis]VEH84652.1 ABC transporter permease [Legionella adelaidensis]
MSELLEFYQKEAVNHFSAIPFIAKLQEKGLEHLQQHGFPTSALEDWKYTKMDSFLKNTFHINEEHNNATFNDTSPFLNITSSSMSIVNGEIFLGDKADNRVIIKTLEQASTEHPELVKKYLSTILKPEHGFHALNMAMLNKGIFIYIPQGVKLQEPLLLTHWQDKENQAHYIHHLIVAEQDSEVSIIEDYAGKEGCSYFTNTITEIFAAKGASVHHFKMQREGKLSYHIGHTSAKQNESSKVQLHTFNIGGKIVRGDTSVHLQEPQARCFLNGIYAPQEGQHIDQHTVVHHQVANCRSEEDYKGILGKKSRAVFNGKVIVAKDAQHTEAKQQNKNLLLAADAEIDTKPQLEIFADDVVCSHGATVGQLDEEALFYFATRGIGAEEASQFLIHAFAAENVKAFGAILSPWVDKLLNKQLR